MGLLTSNQQQFAQRLAKDTGLNERVIGSWMLAEESSGAAVARQASGNNNWLNIGYFDSGPGAIAFNSAFNNPVSAADQTAAFLKGTWGGASSGIRSILSTVGKSPQQEMSAIAGSGWASSGYSGGGTLRTLYGQLGGQLPDTSGSAVPGSAAGGGGGGGIGALPGDALKALMFVALVGLGATLAYFGITRAAGVSPIKAAASSKAAKAAVVA